MNHASSTATGRGENLDRAVVWIVGPYTGPVQTKCIWDCQVQSQIFRKKERWQHFSDGMFWKVATLGRI